MKTNPLKQGAIIANATGIGTVTLDMVRRRAVELALIDGRSAEEVSVTNMDQARRELTGDLEDSETEAAIEAAPESERWDPIHGSTGGKSHENPSEDEDDEGHSDSARLVEEGIQEADHDRMLQAAKLSPR